MAIIESRSSIAVPCETCGGDVAREKAGTGFVHSATFHRRPDEKRKRKGKPKPKAATQQTRDMLALLDGSTPPAAAAEPLAAPGELAPGELAPLAIEDLPAAFEGDMLCPDCEGRCWVVGSTKPKRRRPEVPIPRASPFRVTRPALAGLANAYPLKSQDEPKGYELGDDMHADLTWLGKMSRRIMHLLELEGGAAALEVLGCYSAPDGGSIVALWHLTPAGKKMLRNNQLKLQPRELFSNLREAQRQKFDENRSLLFEAANKQALKVFEWACGLWNETGPKIEIDGDGPDNHEGDIDSILSGLAFDHPGGPVETDDDVDALVQATHGTLRLALAAEPVHVQPPGCEVEFIEPDAGAWAEYQRLIEEADRQIKTALLGQNLVVGPEGERSRQLLLGYGPGIVRPAAMVLKLKEFADRDRLAFYEQKGDNESPLLPNETEKARAALESAPGDLVLPAPPDFAPAALYRFEGDLRDEVGGTELQVASSTFDAENGALRQVIPLGRPLTAEQAEEWRAPGATEQPLFTPEDDEPPPDEQRHEYKVSATELLEPVARGPKPEAV